MTSTENVEMKPEAEIKAEGKVEDTTSPPLKRAAEGVSEEESAEKRPRTSEGKQEEEKVEEVSPLPVTPTPLPPPLVELSDSAKRIDDIKRQVEWYMSDKNLSMDTFFHDKITKTEGNWLEMHYLLSCPKMKALKVTTEEVFSSLQQGGSALVTRLEDASTNTKAAIKRTTPLPPLLKQHRPSYTKKDNQDSATKLAKPHIGGIVMVVSNIPEEVSWQDVKAAVKAIIAEKNGAVWFASEIKASSGECVIVLSPFENDIAFVSTLPLEVNNAKLSITIPYGQELQKRLDSLPEYVVKRRSKKAQSLRKENEKRKQPVVLGKETFQSSNQLRSRIRSLIASYADGKTLDTASADYALALALLKYHPRAEEKLQNMKALKVGPREVSGTTSRCFFVVKEDGTEDDISYSKSIIAVEAKKEEDSAAAATAAKQQAAAAKKEAQKEAKPEAKKEEQKVEAKVEVEATDATPPPLTKTPVAAVEGETVTADNTPNNIAA